MTNSIHTARWIGQLADTGWDIHVFNAMTGGLIPELKGVTAYTFHRPAKSSSNLKQVHYISSLRPLAGLIQLKIPALSRLLWPSRVESLAQLIRHLKPDITHSLEMQNESYPLLEARRLIDGDLVSPWIYSSWGSDLYYFGRQPEHQPRIREVLSSCDYYIADCQRDVELASQFGFKGTVLGVLPAVGGFEVLGMQRLAQPGAGQHPGHHRPAAAG